MTTITAIANTFLKKTTQQAESLTAGKKIIVPVGLKLSVADYSKGEAGHTLVTLTNQDFPVGKWYIFDDHWELPWLKPPSRPLPILPSQVDWDNFEAPVSEYFTVGEVTQKDRRRIPTDLKIQANILRLAERLDEVRDKWGGPIIVTSWYRPPLVNREVGGKSNSQHINGSAVDIAPANGQIYQLQRVVDVGLWRNNALGYGAKYGFVHLDLRPGHIRWNY
jgi:putative chitinase